MEKTRHFLWRPVAMMATFAVALLGSGLTGSWRSTDVFRDRVQAAELRPIALPKPVTTGGRPLMQALSARKTTRAFADKALPLQTVSNLLWAAFGVNRTRDVKQGLGRTAPSAMNSQDITIEVLLADGIYIYDAEANVLRPQPGGDLRAEVLPGPAAKAAVSLIYVAPARDNFAQVDCGFIGQNVYLFAASEGLNAWFYTVHADDVAKKLGIDTNQTVLYAQSVGYAPE